MTSYRNELITGCEYYLEELDRKLNDIIDEKEKITKLLKIYKTATEDETIINTENDIRNKNKLRRNLIKNQERINSIEDKEKRGYISNKNALTKLRNSYYKTARRHLLKKDGKVTIDQKIYNTYFELHRPLIEEFTGDILSVD